MFQSKDCPRRLKKSVGPYQSWDTTWNHTCPQHWVGSHLALQDQGRCITHARVNQSLPWTEVSKTSMNAQLKGPITEEKHEETLLSDSTSIISTFRMCWAAVLTSEGYFHDSGQSSCQNWCTNKLVLKLILPGTSECCTKRFGDNVTNNMFMLYKTYTNVRLCENEVKRVDK